MKYTSAIHMALFGSIVASTIHSGFAVPRPGPASKGIPHQHQQRKTESSLIGLKVDKEGNLYSPRRTTKIDVQRKEDSLHTALAVCLRGGEICVDNEGNFYTPSGLSSLSTATAAFPTIRDISSRSHQHKHPFSSLLVSYSPPTGTLRGGCHNHIHKFGALCVDSEGNLFAATQRGSGSSVWSTFRCRGGGVGLSVDNEGNFYTPTTSSRQQAAPLHRVVTTTLQGNRRLRINGTDDPVLLTKNKLRKKPTISASTSSHGQTKKQPSEGGDENPMAFIGYNNALMET